jgi:hypothetical protein
MSDLASGLDFLVNKSDWKQHRFVESTVPEPGEGQVLFRVDRFAFTANNISYALAGDLLGYWRFFPAPEGWGRIPVMGFADVVRSRHPEVAEGTRCFGFYPMSRHLVIEPSAASAAQIIDGAPHREGLAPAYNQYSPVSADALYHPEHEDVLMLMRGLFLTSFLADDFLAEQDYCGAESVLISSASSKTSIALGYQVSRGGRVRAVGLTSARNLEFVRKLGCYDEVLLYDEVPSLDASRPAVFVDMAGSGPLLQAVHGHFGSQLKHSCSIGVTHWDSERNTGELPGPAPAFFFAPGQIQKRAKEWGPDGLQQRLAAAWSRFRSFSEGWLEVRRGQGRDDVERVYRETLAGRVPPSQGQVLSLQ